MYIRNRVRHRAVSGPQLEQPIQDVALARHLTVDFYDCDPQTLADAGRMEEVLLEAARISGATVLDRCFHNFNPQGVSGVIIISESHFSVHTWPEHDYAAVDIFTCSNSIDIEVAIETLKSSLRSSQVVVSADMHRGVPWNNGAARLIPSWNGKPSAYVLSWQRQYEMSNAWGLLASVDLYNCDPATIRDANQIRTFVSSLCQRLGMRAFGECVVVDFGEEERLAGFSMTQLIETSLISGHFARASNAAYLDIFSCKYFEPRVMAEYALEFFKGSNYRMQVTLRR